MIEVTTKSEASNPIQNGFVWAIALAEMSALAYLGLGCPGLHPGLHHGLATWAFHI